MLSMVSIPLQKWGRQNPRAEMQENAIYCSTLCQRDKLKKRADEPHKLANGRQSVPANSEPPVEDGYIHFT